MLATLVEPRNEEGFIYEIKWDGYRAVAFINPRGVELLSRNNKPFNEKFYPVYDAVQHWPIHAVVDGEIVVLDSNGRPNFGSLQNWKNEDDGEERRP